jgi:hypothetical protein
LFFDSYAYSPKGKYKALQAEVEAKEKAKEEEKKAKKLAKEKAKELAKDFGEDGACSVAVIGSADGLTEEATKGESEEDEA